MCAVPLTSNRHDCRRKTIRHGETVFLADVLVHRLLDGFGRRCAVRLWFGARLWGVEGPSRSALRGERWSNHLLQVFEQRPRVHAHFEMKPSRPPDAFPFSISGTTNVIKSFGQAIWRKLSSVRDALQYV